MKFEFEVLQCDTVEKWSGGMTAYSDRGWELVATHVLEGSPGVRTYIAVFKREKKDSGVGIAGGGQLPGRSPTF